MPGKSVSFFNVDNTLVLDSTLNYATYLHLVVGVVFVVVATRLRVIKMIRLVKLVYFYLTRWIEASVRV